MRIAYVTETYPPEINGVSLTAERAVHHLRQSGHEVQLLRPRRQGEAARRDGTEWRSAGGPLPMYPGLRWGAAWPATLLRAWRSAPPDLVHVATPGPLAWSALSAARQAGLPTSADFRTNFHAYSHHYGCGWLAPMVLGYLRWLHAMADVTFVPTTELARRLVCSGFHRVHVVGRGVDAARFSPERRDPWLRHAWGADAADRVLLHVGRLAAEKNVPLALQTFERLRASRPGLRMVVVGDGPLRASLQRAHPEVHFAGERLGDDLARHYASADVFLFPSLTDTFGNVTLEALASGLALAAFDTAAARRHVCDGVNGFLAEPRAGAAGQDVFLAAAASAVAAAAPNGPLRRQARDTARRADWNSALRQFENELRAVAGRRTLVAPHAKVA